MAAKQSDTGYWVYKAEFDQFNNHNSAPMRCNKCGHNYFRLSMLYWICDKCEHYNDPDSERGKRYKEKKEQERLAKMKKRGKRKAKVEDTELDGLSW
jgi:ribosomal protein L37AE/L43A